MPKFQLEVPHTFTAEEAKSRLERFVDSLQAQYGDKVSELEQAWNGNKLTFVVQVPDGRGQSTGQRSRHRQGSQALVEQGNPAPIGAVHLLPKTADFPGHPRHQPEGERSLPLGASWQSLLQFEQRVECLARLAHLGGRSSAWATSVGEMSRRHR